MWQKSFKIFLKKEKKKKSIFFRKNLLQKNILFLFLFFHFGEISYHI